MYRISESMDWAELERLAQDIGARLRFRRARCQHGKTRRQTCIDCEGGYVDDGHTLAHVGNLAKWNGVPCVAVSDDGEDVAYLARRDEPKIARRETRPTTATRYAVILAPGYYGDYTLVYSAHRTLRAARRAARPTSHVHYDVIALLGARRGDRVYSGSCASQKIA